MRFPRLGRAWVQYISIVLSCALLIACSSGGAPPTINPKNDADNKKPVANAGPAISVRGGEVVTLDASASQDPDGPIKTYIWTQLEGTEVTLNTPDKVQSTFTAPQTGGTLLFQLRVFDDVNATDATTVAVSIRSGVAVFINPAYVNYSNTSNPSSEASNLEATVRDRIKEDVRTFTNYTNSGIAVAVGSNILAMAIPELSLKDLSIDIPLGGRQAISTYVGGGGILIIFRNSSGDNGLKLTNLIFNWNLAAAAPAGNIRLNTSKTNGTPFASLPSTLAANTSITTVNQGTLPTGTVPIYVDDVNGSTAVTVTPWGKGKVIIFGWDWFDAAPIGSQDGGWIDALSAALDAGKM